MEASVSRAERRAGRVTAAAAVAALVSALGGAWVSVATLNDLRERFGVMSQSQREDAVPVILGFDDRPWEALRRSLGAGDRYAIVAEGLLRFEARNYAAYTLLPAIQVSDPADADAVIYYAVGTPDPACRPLGDGVCALFRDRR